jgi:hypothetical protein
MCKYIEYPYSLYLLVLKVRDVFDNFKPTTIWIYHCEYNQSVCFGWCRYCGVNGPTRFSQTMTQGYNVRLCYFGWKHPIFLTLLLVIISCAPPLSFDKVDKWKINNQCSTSCVIPGHVMIFLIVFSVPVSSG